MEKKAPRAAVALGTGVGSLRAGHAPRRCLASGVSASVKRTWFVSNWNSTPRR
jgi:hypothetical protein